MKRWHDCSPATRGSLLAVGIFPAHAWAGAVLALAATTLAPGQRLSRPGRWLAAIVLAGLVTLSFGKALPTDDLLRHLSAWQLGFDYRAQYPWSQLPAANLWIGFDAGLGLLQQLGVPKAALLQWLPGLALILAGGVIHGSLSRAPLARRAPAELVLALALLGLLLVAPRALLARPELFITLFAATAWWCRTRTQTLLWATGFLALTPVYWLGGAYAPFVLVARGLAGAQRLALAGLLMAGHLAFWQAYTGDYPGLLTWLASTLSIPAIENRPLVTALVDWPRLGFAVLLAACLGMSVRGGLLRLRRHWPVFLLLGWLLLPNQIRYQAALALAALPWLLQRVAVWLRFRRQRVPVLPLLALVGLTAVLLVPQSEPAPHFGLSGKARVYSEQPYATVFYGAPGIAVEPSFALGATLPAYWQLLHKGIFDCHRAAAGGFTHLVEKSLTQVPACLHLEAVDGPWRLWRLAPGARA